MIHTAGGQSEELSMARCTSLPTGRLQCHSCTLSCFGGMTCHFAGPTKVCQLTEILSIGCLRSFGTQQDL